VAEGLRVDLAVFDVELRPSTQMRWPAQGSYGAEDRVEFEPGAGDLLALRHAPSRRFLRREPVHENLMIELVAPLATSALATLRTGRVLYRAGSDRITYQSSRAVATLVLVTATSERWVIDASISLIAPEIDSEERGVHQLSGQIVVAR
jgi:hypothetical protein